MCLHDEHVWMNVWRPMDNLGYHSLDLMPFIPTRVYWLASKTTNLSDSTSLTLGLDYKCILSYQPFYMESGNLTQCIQTHTRRQRNKKKKDWLWGLKEEGGRIVKKGWKGSRGEFMEHKGFFLGQWNYLVWYYNGREISLYICQNP